jgi:hypothetical protein
MSLAIVLFGVGVAAPVHAGSQFVASNGTDSANCARTAPCATVFAAIANAAPNDTIVCLDTMVDPTGLISILKSIDINCPAGLVLRDHFTGDAAISINIPVSASDPFRTVRLRGVSVLGSADTSKVVPIGIHILAAAVVQLENVVVSDANQQGVFDTRTGGQTKLFITDSIIRNNGGVGIGIGSQGPTTIVLDNVRSENNLYGLAVAAGNNVSVSRSVFSGNTYGVEGDGGAQIIVDGSTMTHNNVGVQSASSVRLSNNNIAFNTTAIAGSSGTFGNNRFSGNQTNGFAPTPLGGATSDVGQQ